MLVNSKTIICWGVLLHTPTIFVSVGFISTNTFSLLRHNIFSYVFCSFTRGSSYYSLLRSTQCRFSFAIYSIINFGSSGLYWVGLFEIYRQRMTPKIMVVGCKITGFVNKSESSCQSKQPWRLGEPTVL
jgi:hypothetical protein